MPDIIELENQQQSKSASLNDDMSSLEEQMKLEVEQNEKEQIEKYWRNCNSDCRACAITFNIFHFVIQITKLVPPTTDQNKIEKMVNIGYMCVTVLNMALLLLSFRKRFGLGLSWYPIIITLFRMPFRWLDFENTRSFETNDIWYSRLVT